MPLPNCCLVYFSYSYLSRWKESWRDNIRDVLEGLGWDMACFVPSPHLYIFIERSKPAQAMHLII